MNSKPRIINHRDREQARALLESPRFFNAVIEALRKSRLVGEESNALALYIGATSRVLSRPVNFFVKGPSSAGKNYLVSRVLSLFPSECVCEISSVSDQALNYSGDQLSHKIVFLQERNEKSGNLHPARSLISEQRIERKVTTRVKGGGRTMTSHVTRGPIAFITTTTKPGVEIDDETRNFSIFIDDSAAQTKRIVTGCVESDNQQLSENEVRVWHEVQRLVAERASCDIALPEWFAAVAENICTDNVCVRRYFPAFIEACKTVRLIRSFNRESRGLRAMRVRFTDYAIAAIILDRALALPNRCSDAVLQVTRAVEEVVGASESPVGARDVARHLGLPKDKVYQCLREACSLGSVRRANGNERNNRKLYVPGVAPSFLPPLSKVYELTGAKKPVRFAHPFRAEPLSYGKYSEELVGTSDE